VKVPNTISWADEERDLTAWLGNDLQNDAFNRLYSLTDKINKCTDKKILTDWKYLQTSDHFYYMSTKMLSDGEVHQYFNPYDSPYDAYINYMNILSDFIIRLNSAVPESDTEKEIATLAAIIYEKNLLIEKYEEELRRLKKPVPPSPSVKAAQMEMKSKTPSRTKQAKKESGKKEVKTQLKKTSDTKKVTAAKTKPEKTKRKVSAGSKTAIKPKK